MRRLDPAEVPGPGQEHHCCSTQWGPRKLILSADPTTNSAGQFGSQSARLRTVLDTVCEDRGHASPARSAKPRSCSSAAAPTRCARRTPRPGVASEAGELTCTDIVPAARDAAARRPRRPRAVLAGLDDWPDDLPDDLEDRLVELPVTYDGPDLESVGRAHAGSRRRGGRRRHRATRVRGRVLRVRAGLRLPQRAAGGAARAAAGGAAVQGAAGFGRAGRHVHRGLPAVLAGRLAADRPHRGAALGPRPGPAGAAVARHPGPVHRC